MAKVGEKPGEMRASLSTSGVQTEELNRSRIFVPYSPGAKMSSQPPWGGAHGEETSSQLYSRIVTSVETLGLRPTTPGRSRPNHTALAWAHHLCTVPVWGKLQCKNHVRRVYNRLESTDGNDSVAGSTVPRRMVHSPQSSLLYDPHMYCQAKCPSNDFSVQLRRRITRSGLVPAHQCTQPDQRDGVASKLVLHRSGGVARFL